jgi:predicted outer membrane repeat protein
LALQPDGKILVGGEFTSLGGQARNYIGRLHPDGRLDETFNPNANNYVYALALQPNGAILVGGWFTSLGGALRNRIARLLPNGILDTTFDPGANNNIFALTPQPNGKLLVGGAFTTLDGKSRERIGRLSNHTAALQELLVDRSGSSVTWLRSGAGPEVWRVTFESSTNGVDFTTLGSGTRIMGGWRLEGLTLPKSQNLWVRARGYYSTGMYNGSGSIIESVRYVYLTPPATRYVKPQPVGLKDCSSWANACYLQDALFYAKSGDQIWVAEGVHYPDQGLWQTDNDPSVSFVLKENVKVYGGFEGTETSLGQRDWTANRTFLSGDVDNNDTDSLVGRNAYHVVVAENLSASTILDGFNITGGMADGSGNEGDGGGIWNSKSHITLANLEIYDNMAVDDGGGMHNLLSEPILTNITFRNNEAGDGGGLSTINESNPTLQHVEFLDNYATVFGGGMNCNTGEATLSHVTFSNNHADYSGGGVFSLGGGSGTRSIDLNNITFTGNTSNENGGALYINSSYAYLTNITFAGNTSQKNGGALDIQNSFAAYLTNITFAGNTSQENGGALSIYKSYAYLTNVTFSGNSAATEGGAIHVETAQLNLNNVTLSDNSAVSGGGIYAYGTGSSVTHLKNVIIGNSSSGGDCVKSGDAIVSATHTLIESTGANACGLVNGVDANLVGLDPQLDPLADNGGDTHTHALLPGSPAIDAGTNTDCPATDQRGEPRPQDGDGDGLAVCDIGAYERETLQVPATITSPDHTTFTIGVYNTFTVTATGAPPPAITAFGALPDGVTFVDNDNGTATLSGIPPAGSAGEYILTINAFNIVPPDDEQTFTLTIVPAIAATRYVKPYPVGLGDCSSWTNACYLQDALFEAQPGDQIWVAQGDHYPDEGQWQTDDDPYSSFVLKDGVAVFGGFVGTETSLDQRDWHAHPTFLSGDVDNNDAAGLVGRNAYHVVVAENLSASAALDGFYITGGMADGGGREGDGGGIYNLDSYLTLANLEIYDNMASGYGGGIYNADGGSNLTNITFRINSANTGGGLADIGGNPILYNITFHNNHASNTGGGIYSADSLSNLNQVTFSNNTADQTGGAISIQSTGSDDSQMSVADLTNVTFSGNSALQQGGAIYIWFSEVNLTNITLSDNSAASGGGVYLDGYQLLQLRNVILGNSSSGGDCVKAASSPINATHSLLESTGANACGLVNGVNGNLVGFDPLLDSLDDNGGDTRTHALLPGSPAIDAGTNTGCPATDQRGEPRPQDGDGDGLAICDIGAYEYVNLLFPPTITSPDNFTFMVGVFSSFYVTTTGNPIPTIHKTGELPSGITFTDNGDGTAALAGTPEVETVGDYPLTLTASNGVEPDAFQYFTLRVQTPTSAPEITSADHTTFVVGIYNTFTVTTTGVPTPAITYIGYPPDGVTFTDNGDGTATLDGIPAAGTEGEHVLRITASSEVPPDAQQTFVLTVVTAPTTPPAITSADNATFTVGTSGTFTVTTTGYPTPAISKSGALPSGVTFTDNGDGTAALAGTPAIGTAGDYLIDITASNGVEPDATQAFTLTVVPAPAAPAITSADNATFIIGSSGTFTVTTTGYPTPAISKSGALPSGVTFTDNGDGTAALAGTPGAGTAGDYIIDITASNGVEPDATQAFTLTVVPASAAPAITSADNATLTIGSTGTFTVTTTGYPTPAISKSGALPSGVTFTDNGDGTAALSGTPGAGTAGDYIIDITASNGVLPNATQAFTLTVVPALAAPAITSADNTTFTVGTSGTFTVTTTGYPTPAINISGDLPSGVTFTDNGDGTAALAGTPAAGTVGDYVIELTASNGVEPDATQEFILTVVPASAAPAITSADNTTFIVGTNGTFTVATTGYPTPTIIKTGSLPSGVTLTDNGDGTAALAGTPAAGTAGDYIIDITASNGVEPDATQTFTLTVVPASAAPAITSADNTTFTIGVYGKFTITTTGNPIPDNIWYTGSLGDGVQFTNNGDGTATIDGIPGPDSDPEYILVIYASNGVEPDATQTFTLTVVPAPAAPAITSADYTTFMVGSSDTFTVTTTGYPTPAINISGDLPSGVTFTDNGDGTAALAGTPAIGTAGDYLIDITASNGLPPDAEQAFTLTVVPAPVAPAITSADYTTFMVGSSDTFTVTATGYPTPTINKIGDLPSGVTLTDNGDGTAALAGTPAAGTAGDYIIDITASNGVEPDDTQAFTLTVVPAPVAPAITSADYTTFMVGSSDTFTVTATGYPTPTINKIGDLPSGVTFTDNGDGTATLAGTPAAGTVGDYVIELIASNGVEPDDTQEFTLTVVPAPVAPDITSADNATFIIGSSGTFTVTTTGYPTPTISKTGALPSGVTFTDNGDGTATLAGTPGAGTAGEYNIDVTASNGVEPDASQLFTFKVNEGGQGFFIFLPLILR